MAQMRIILRSKQLYKTIKPHLESISNNDNKLYQFVEEATNLYITEIKPKHISEKAKLDHYTESIRACIARTLNNNDDDVKIY